MMPVERANHWAGSNASLKDAGHLGRRGGMQGAVGSVVALNTDQVELVLHHSRGNRFERVVSEQVVEVALIGEFQPVAPPANGPSVRDLDAAALQVVDEWLRNNTYPALDANLRRISGRLMGFLAGNE